MNSSINNNVNLGGQQNITGTKNFTSITGTTQDGTDNSTKLATTATVRQQMAITGGLSTFSKAQSGYMKLLNGLRVQWGYVSSISPSGTVTLPTAFSSASSYSVVCCVRSTTNYGNPYYVGSQTSTNFTVDSNGSSAVPVNWVAIGY